MANDISNTDDTIDSRDIIARIEELTEERDAFVIGAPDGEETPDPAGWARANKEDAAELAALESLQEDLEDYCDDWRHGVQLIRDSYFETAMDEMLEEIGELPKNLPSYLSITVDYNALQMDYTSAEFDGVTYWAR